MSKKTEMAKDADTVQEAHGPEGVWAEHAEELIGGMAVLMLGLGTVVYRLLEDWSWVDAFYFSAVALTTVGFGDITPTTTVSKLFTVFYIFSGISIIGLVLNEFLKRHAHRVGERKGLQ